MVSKKTTLALDRGAYKTARSIADFFGWEVPAKLTRPVEKEEQDNGGKRMRIGDDATLAVRASTFFQPRAAQPAAHPLQRHTVPSFLWMAFPPATRPPHAQGLVFLWRLREERQRVDWLECTLAMTQSAMGSVDQRLHYAGCHVLWDIALKAHEHAQVREP